MEEKEVYKVAYTGETRMTHQQSFMLSSCALGSLTAMYELGIKTYPPVEGTPLFAYESLEAARVQLERMSRPELCRILRCRATPWFGRCPDWVPPTGILSAMWSVGSITEDHMRAAWQALDLFDQTKLMSDRCDVWWSVPAGTVLCTTITPIEVVS